MNIINGAKYHYAQHVKGEGSGASGIILGCDLIRAIEGPIFGGGTQQEAAKHQGGCVVSPNKVYTMYYSLIENAACVDCGALLTVADESIHSCNACTEAYLLRAYQDQY